MHKFLRGFVYAFHGIVRLFRYGRNAKFHLCAAIVVVALGLWLGLNSNEWTAIALCIGSVMAAEAFNTAIEELADRVTREQDPAIGRVKDMAAGAVLLLALAAVVIGCIIFIPKLLTLYSFN